MMMVPPRRRAAPPAPPPADRLPPSQSVSCCFAAMAVSQPRRPLLILGVHCMADNCPIPETAVQPALESLGHINFHLKNNKTPGPHVCHPFPSPDFKPGFLHDRLLIHNLRRKFCQYWIFSTISKALPVLVSLNV